MPIQTLADVLCNACQLLDSVKADWQREGCWSEWDQEVRDGLSRELQKCYAEVEESRVQPEPLAKWCCDGEQASGEDQHNTDCRYHHSNYQPKTAIPGRQEPPK